MQTNTQIGTYPQISSSADCSTLELHSLPEKLWLHGQGVNAALQSDVH